MAYKGNNLVKRRGFVLGFARFGVLGLIGGLAVFGESKRRRLLREGKCVGRGICGGCGVFADCGLPQATSLKATKQNGGGDER